MPGPAGQEYRREMAVQYSKRWKPPLPWPSFYDQLRNALTDDIYNVYMEDYKAYKRDLIDRLGVKEADHVLENHEVLNSDPWLSKGLTQILRHGGDGHDCGPGQQSVVSLAEQVNQWNDAYNLHVEENPDMTPGAIPAHVVIPLLSRKRAQRCMSDPQFLAFVLLTNGKQRFKVEVRNTPRDLVHQFGDDMVFLSANQGHSRLFASMVRSNMGTGVPVACLDDAPAFAVHATTLVAARNIISDNKLCSQSRTHIHFAVSISGDMSQRSMLNNLLRGTVLIFLNLKMIFQDRIPFLLTQNNVGLVKSNGLDVRRYILDIVDRRHDYSLLRDSDHDLDHAIVYFLKLLRESENECQEEFMSKEELAEITEVEENELPAKAGPENPLTENEAKAAIDKGSDLIEVKNHIAAKKETLSTILEEQGAASSSTARSSMWTPAKTELQEVKTEELPDFGEGTEVDDPMDTSEDPPEPTLEASTPHQQEPAASASVIAVDMELSDDSDEDDDYSLVTSQHSMNSSQYSLVSAMDDVRSLRSDDSALASLEETDTLQLVAAPVAVSDFHDPPPAISSYPDDPRILQRDSTEEYSGLTPIRNSRLERLPGSIPSFLYDWHIRASDDLPEWILLQQSARGATIFESVYEHNNGRPPKAFLDWNRIASCNTCHVNIAPICAGCQICTCLDCRVKIQQRRQPDHDEIWYWCQCRLGFPYSSAEIYSEGIDAVWDSWRYSHTYIEGPMDPINGMLKSPCGRCAPSPEHKDHPPRYLTDTQQAASQSDASASSDQAYRGRSRTPLPRRRAPPLRLASADQTLEVTATGGLMVQHPAGDLRTSTPYRDASDWKNIDPKRQRLSASVDSNNRNPEMMDIERRLTQSQLADRPTLRPGAPTAHQLQGLDALQDWEAREMGKLPVQSSDEPLLHQTPTATSEFVKTGRKLIEYQDQSKYSILRCIDVNRPTKDVQLTVKMSHYNLTQDDAYDEEKVRDAFVKVAICNLLSGETIKKNYHWLNDPFKIPFRKELENYSSLQVQILAVNLGDMFSRKMYIAGKYKVPQGIALKIMPMFHAWASAGAHIWLTAEAEGFESAPALDLLKKYGLIGCVATPPDDSLVNCRSIACHIKDAGGAAVFKVEEMWEPWTEEQRLSRNPSWSFGGCIFEVVFGYDQATQRPAHRCGRERYTVAMFHLNNEAAKKPDKARQLMLRFLRLCVKHKVDAVFGDGNQAVNMSQKYQTIVDRLNSTCAMAMRQTQLTYNKDRELWERFSVYPIEGESEKNLNASASDRSNYDTMTGWVLSWSKDNLAAIRRKELQEKTYELRRKQREQGHPNPFVQNSDSASARESQLSPQEEDFLAATWRVGYVNSKSQLNELKVTVSEFAKYLTNHDLFLEEGNDGRAGGGWHHFLSVNIRQAEVRDRRVRGTGNWKRQFAPNPYSSYATKLKFTALANMIMQSGAMNASASCDADSAVADDESSGWWLLILLAVSLMGNLMILIYCCWFRWQKTSKEKLEHRCLNPSCGNWANPGWATCCRICPHGHTAECHFRQAKLRHPDLNDNELLGLRRDSRVPSILPERVRSRRTRDAVVQTIRSEPPQIPRDEIGINEHTKNVYHFNDNCRFMEHVRNSSGGRIFRPCRVCFQQEDQERNGR